MKGMDNPVGALQERAQAEGLPAPQYVLEDAQGQSHCPTFTIKVTWQLRSAIGVASNKVKQTFHLINHKYETFDLGRKKPREKQP